MKIPKIIHQVWSGIEDPLPDFFKELGDTWKRHHLQWKYEFWDEDRIRKFLMDFYPQYIEKYDSFRYNIQRWDSIRYLILQKMGGLYVDFDTECLSSFDKILENHTCCFSMESPDCYNRSYYFNNALMASIPNHPFMTVLVENVFKYEKDDYKGIDKGKEVLLSTGPLFLINQYEKFASKEQVYLIPYQYVSPLLKEELIIYYEGKATPSLKAKLERAITSAYSIHYFFNTWLHGVKIRNLLNSR